MIKNIAIFAVSALILLSLVGCKSRDTSSTTSASVLSPKVEETVQPAVDWETNLKNKIKTATLESDTNAIVCMDQSGDSYRQFHLVKGSTVEILERQGYRFDGYKSGDGVTYVDENGEVIKECAEKDLLYLKAEFEPEEFTINFFQNGRTETDKATLTCLYTDDILPELRLGRTIKNSEGDELCVVGYADENGNIVIDGNDISVKIEDLVGCVNYTDKTVNLYDIITPISWKQVRLNAYDVSDKGILNQTLNSSGIAKDVFDIGENIDVVALKSVGYTYAEITLECEISAMGGTQYIQVLNAWPDDKKEIENHLLLDSGKIEIKTESGESETYTEQPTKVSIDNFIDEDGNTIECIYVGYNAGGLPIAKKNWTSGSMSIEIKFLKD